MKTRHLTPPLTKQTIGNLLDSATSHLVRADHQFRIQGPRQKDHWEQTRQHLIWARGHLDEASAVLDYLLVILYGPLHGK